MGKIITLDNLKAFSTALADRLSNAFAAVTDDIGTIARDLAQYAEADPITLSSGQAGKYIDTTGAVQSNSAYAISSVVSLKKGYIYLVKPTTALGTGIALCAKHTTSQENVLISYTYTYNADGTIATATADYDSTLVYTYTWSNGVATITDADGNVVTDLPGYRTVTAGSYVPLFKNLSSDAPASGYYAVLANEDCQAVFSLPTADITGTVTVASYGLFRSIANNKADKLAVEELKGRTEELEEENDSLTDAFMGMLSAMLSGNSGYLLLAKAGSTVLGVTANANNDTWLWIDNDTVLNFSSDTASQNNVLEVAYFSVPSSNSLYGKFYCNASLAAINTAGLDTSNVTNMGSMFYGCSALTSLDVSGFDTSKVTAIFAMFYSCSALTSLDVSGFDTSKVTNMQSMFARCSALTSLDVSGWDTSNVTNMKWMFSGCSALTSLDVSGWDTSNVTNIFEMFSGCSKLRYITLGTGFFNTTQTIPFSGATNLGLNEDGTDNGWLAHLAETAPEITDGTARTISLPTKVKALSGADTYIEQLTEKGYTIA